MSLINNIGFTGVDVWKPIQTGELLSTTSVINLYSDLVKSGKFTFLLPGRINQDSVENLFSCIRGLGDSHPTPLRFRHNLRLVSLSIYEN